MQVKVEIDDDVANEIVRIELKYAISSLVTDLENRKDDRGIAVFEMDKDADIALIKKHIKAIKRTLSYFSVPGETND